MLPHKNRLKLPTSWGKTNPDFQFKTNLLKLVGKNSNKDNPVRIGFIISSKVGKAVVRNRLRRFLANYFYKEIVSLRPSQEIIIIVFPAAATSTNEEISLSLNKILQKVRFK